MLLRQAVVTKKNFTKRIVGGISNLPTVRTPDVRNAMQSSKGFPQQVKAAKSFVGKRVWFSPQRDRVHMVQGCDVYGMLTLDGVLGQVSAYWVTLVV